MTRYGIKHRTTRWWLAVIPSVAEGNRLYAQDDAEASTYRTAQQAETEREGLEEFAGAHVVEPVEIEMHEDPDEDEEGDG